MMHLWVQTRNFIMSIYTIFLSIWKYFFSSKKVKPHNYKLHDFIVQKASMLSLSTYYVSGAADKTGIKTD